MPEERRYDKTVADSFPASDPPANTGITGAEPAKREKQDPSKGDPTDNEPKGTPTSDRFATETAAAKHGEGKVDTPS